MDTVELAPAYSWDCPECGRENFQRCVSHVLDRNDPEDADLIRASLGIPDGEPIPPRVGGQMQTRPNRVTCRHCGTEYKALDTGMHEPDECGDADEEGQ